MSISSFESLWQAQRRWEEALASALPKTMESRLRLLVRPYLNNRAGILAKRFWRKYFAKE